MAEVAPSREAVLTALAEIEDPEVPVSIVALGLVQRVDVQDGHVEVELAPTYAACPGRAYILGEAERRLRQLSPDVIVRWSNAPTWKRQRITPRALADLRDFGVGVPAPEGNRVACPYCGASETRLEREFGSAVCKALFYCDACRTPFEALKGSW